MERRNAIIRSTDFQTRVEDSGMVIEGYFAVFDGVYPLWDGAQERVAPHAFDNTVSGDIRALTNHDTTLVLGRTTAKTLELRVDEKGLWGRILINAEDTSACDTYARVARGDVNQCSFGFEIVRQSKTVLADGTVEFVLEEVKLHEVSVCTFPAYADTAVEARRRDYEQEEKRELELWKSAQLERLKKE